MHRSPRTSKRPVKLYRHCWQRGRRQFASELSEAAGLAGSPQFCFFILDVPLRGEVLESGRAVLPGQVLVELVLQGVQTVAVTGAGAKLGDVKAGGVGHVDHESVGEDHQVVLLRK